MTTDVEGNLATQGIYLENKTIVASQCVDDINVILKAIILSTTCLKIQNTRQKNNCSLGIKGIVFCIHILKGKAGFVCIDKLVFTQWCNIK